MKLRAKAYLRIAAKDWRKKYDYVGDFSEGLAEVRRESRYGFVDKTGKEVVKPKYDYAGDFHNGFADVRLGRKWGFVDKQGKEVVKPKYYYVGHFIEGLAAVKLNKWGFIDQQDNIVIPLKYDDVGNFHDGLAVVELGDKKGWVTREGKELLLSKDKHIQIKNLIELEKITEEELINWVKEQIVK